MEFHEFKTLSDRIVDSVGEVFVGERILLMKMLARRWLMGTCCSRTTRGWARRCWRRSSPRVTGCEWGRVQFTADLMPSDITGIRVWKSQYRVLAGERPGLHECAAGRRDQPSTPKTQSALLEAMEERQVTIRRAP